MIITVVYSMSDEVTVLILFPVFHQPIRDQYLGSCEQCTANQRPVFRLHGDHIFKRFMQLGKHVKI